MSAENDATGYNTFERSTPLDKDTPYQAQPSSRTESAYQYYPGKLFDFFIVSAKGSDTISNHQDSGIRKHNFLVKFSISLLNHVISTW